MNYDPINDAERLNKVHTNYKDLMLYANSFLHGIVSEFEGGLIKEGMSLAQKINFRTILEMSLENFFCSKLNEKERESYPFDGEGKFIGNQKFTVQNLVDYVKQQRELRKDLEQRLPEMKRQYKERQNAKEQFYLGEPLTPPESQPAASNEAPPERKPTLIDVENNEIPKTFEDLFFNPDDAEPCLKILSELPTPVIDAANNYIGKAKGVFPLWIGILKKYQPNPLIKHFKDVVYKDLLNQKVKGLNLTKDASEFRKQYKRIENSRIRLDIMALLSQYSQKGK